MGEPSEAGSEQTWTPSRLAQIRWILIAGIGLGTALTVVTYTIMVPSEGPQYLFAVDLPLMGVVIVSAALAVAVTTMLDASKWSDTDRPCPRCDGEMRYGIDTDREMYRCQVCGHYERYLNHD